MATLLTIRFQFKAPLHIGSVRADFDATEQMIHSDKLYAAILQAWQQLGMSEEIDQVQSSQSFALSSLFPYTKAGDAFVYLFPKPYGFLNDDSLDDGEKPLPKKFKKVQYFDQTYFQYFLHKTPITLPYQEDVRGEFLTKYKIDEKFMQRKVYPRAAVPRNQRDDTTIYYLERIFFAPGSGLYTIVHFEDDDMITPVLAALQFLGDEGIGTDRHVGNGQFEISASKESPIDDLPSSSQLLNLSLFCPADAKQLQSMLGADTQESASNVRFEIVKRGGWITSDPYSSLRKKSINMFREGGVFHQPQSQATNQWQVLGKRVDLTPDSEELAKPLLHPIIRNGKSLFIPVIV